MYQGGLLYPMIVFWGLHRGSDMRAHVLFNLLCVFGKSDKMRGLLSILLFVRNKFNKFNNTGARMLDSFLSHDISST